MSRDPLAALFAAVDAAPDDDAPRRVLADALLELGDPRGELIALQLAPVLDDARIRALLDAHRAEWAGKLDLIGDVVFERGFPARVTIGGPAVVKLGALQLRPTIHTLALRLDRGDQMPKRVHVPASVRTFELEARFHGLPAIKAGAALRRVALDVATVARGDLAGLAAIADLQLRANHLDEAALAPVTGLRALVIAALQRIVDLRHLTRLEELTTYATALPRLAGPIRALRCPMIRVGQIVDPLPLRVVSALATPDDLPHLEAFVARYPDLDELTLQPVHAIAGIAGAIAELVGATRVRTLTLGPRTVFRRAAPGNDWSSP
nr:TIGR02996 domain-containing protein [Kofleriaceae bacterium]